VSFDESKAVYHCHGAACDFSGGAGSLARELGLARRLSPAEYREARQNRRLADRAARVLYERVQTRRFDILGRVRTWGQVEVAAHKAGTDHPATWDALTRVYRERPALLAEIEILENWHVADLIRYLTAGTSTQQRVIDRVIEAGITDHAFNNRMNLLVRSA
jgi:hypothetical protein